MQCYLCQEEVTTAVGHLTMPCCKTTVCGDCLSGSGGKAILREGEGYYCVGLLLTGRGCDTRVTPQVINYMLTTARTFLKKGDGDAAMELLTRAARLIEQENATAVDKAATVGLDPVTLGWACALPCKTMGCTEVFSLEGGCDVIKCRRCNKVQNLIPNMEPGQHSYHIDKFLKDIARVNVKDSTRQITNLAKMNHIVWKAFHFDGLLNMLELCRGDAAKVRGCAQKLTHNSCINFQQWCLTEYTRGHEETKAITGPSASDRIVQLADATPPVNRAPPPVGQLPLPVQTFHERVVNLASTNMNSVSGNARPLSISVPARQVHAGLPTATGIAAILNAPSGAPPRPAPGRLDPARKALWEGRESLGPIRDPAQGHRGLPRDHSSPDAILGVHSRLRAFLCWT